MQSSTPKCLSNNPASHICTTSDCDQNTFMCSTKQCPCQSPHQKCPLKTTLKQIIQKLYEKGKGTQKSIIKYSLILRIYQTFANRILSDMNEMMNKNSLLGLEQHEYQFEQIIKGQKLGVITGDAAFSVIESLKNFPTSIFEQISGEEQFIKKIESQFSDSLSNLKTLWKFRVQHSPAALNQEIEKFKQNERILKDVISNKTYWLEINGKQEQNYSNISDLKEVTGIGFSECNTNIIRLLGTHCKGLKNFGVRPDAQKFDDTEAEEIANNLKNLTRLTLHNHNIGDVGAIKLAQNLKSLQVFVIYGNKLTAEGEEVVSGLLPPRCTKFLTGEPS